MWDSEVVAAIRRWIIVEEEKDLDHVACAEDVPSWARISLVERSLRSAERRVYLKYRKGQWNEYYGLGVSAMRRGSVTERAMLLGVQLS